MKDRALEGAEEVFAEGEGENLVGSEGHITQSKGVEEAVVDAALSAFADHREARKHQGVEIAVDGAAHAAEFFGQIVQRRPGSALGQSLDQLPLARELVATHAV